MQKEQPCDPLIYATGGDSNDRRIHGRRGDKGTRGIAGLRGSRWSRVSRGRRKKRKGTGSEAAGEMWEVLE